MELSQALEFVSRSDPGMVRSHNEDAVYCNPAFGLAILADGMGGYNAGEVASGMVTTLLGSELEKAFGKISPYQLAADVPLQAKVILEAEIARANSSVYQAAQSQPQYAGMGTTLVMAVFFDNSLMVAHIGDSRMYRLRGEDFQQITRDHSLLQEQIDSGMLTVEEARHSQNKNLVTRAVGIDPTVEPEIHVYLSILLGRSQRHGSRRGYRFDGADAFRQSQSGGDATHRDGQRQRRTRQCFGDPGSRQERISGSAGHGWLAGAFAGLV
jgi:protein phosphatase